MLLASVKLRLQVVLVKRLAARRGRTAGRAGAEATAIYRDGCARLRAMVASCHESRSGADWWIPAWVVREEVSCLQTTQVS